MSDSDKREGRITIEKEGGRDRRIKTEEPEDEGGVITRRRKEKQNEGEKEGGRRIGRTGRQMTHKTPLSFIH